jgi:hypothetical protein
MSLNLTRGDDMPSITTSGNLARLKQLNALPKDEQENVQNVTVVSSTPQKASWSLSSLGTPGGIGLLLLVILVLIFFLTDYHGRSRAEWIWLAFTKKAKIKPQILKSA